MVASLLNTLLGLWLVYAAVLDLALLEGSAWPLALAALALVALGLWAYSSDYLKWPGITNAVVGVVLLVLLLSGARVLSHALTFWAAFWSGNIAGVLSLWSVLYRHVSPDSAEPDFGGGGPASKSRPESADLVPR